MEMKDPRSRMRRKVKNLKFSDAERLFQEKIVLFSWNDQGFQQYQVFWEIARKSYQTEANFADYFLLYWAFLENQLSELVYSFLVSFFLFFHIEIANKTDSKLSLFPVPNFLRRRTDSNLLTVFSGAQVSKKQIEIALKL